MLLAVLLSCVASAVCVYRGFSPYDFLLSTDGLSTSRYRTLGNTAASSQNAYNTGRERNSVTVVTDGWKKCNKTGQTVLSACLDVLLADYGLTTTINDKLPSPTALQKAVGVFSEKNCQHLATLLECLKDAPECLSEPALTTLTQTNADAEGYTSFFVVSDMKCNKAEAYASYESCSQKIGAASTEDQTAIVMCYAKNIITDCKSLTAVADCEVPLVRKLCGDMTGMCTYEAKEQQMMQLADQECIDKNERMCNWAVLPASLSLVLLLLTVLLV